MNTVLVERRLLFEPVGGGERKEMIVRIGQPYWDADASAALCPREYAGFLPNLEPAIGVDAVHALSLALDIDGMLKPQSAKYQFFWSDGTPYFD